jgi:hypothetical protein
VSVTEFFRYLLGCEPSAELAVQLIEAYGRRAQGDREQMARSR